MSTNSRIYTCCFDETSLGSYRLTAQELRDQIGNWNKVMIHELNNSQLAMKQKIEEEFSQEREDSLKA
jgi:hypothetical protein